MGCALASSRLHGGALAPVKKLIDPKGIGASRMRVADFDVEKLHRLNAGLVIASADEPSQSFANEKNEIAHNGTNALKQDSDGFYESDAEIDISYSTEALRAFSRRLWSISVTSHHQHLVSTSLAEPQSTDDEDAPQAGSPCLQIGPSFYLPRRDQSSPLLPGRAREAS